MPAANICQWLQNESSCAAQVSNHGEVAVKLKVINYLMTVDYQGNTDPNCLRVYFIRHGQTDHNVQKILQGHIDIDINGTGLSQSKQLAAHLSTIKFDKIVSSDLIRCVNTSKEVIAQQQFEVPMRTTDNFREREMGVVQGMYLRDALSKYGDLFRNMGEKLELLIERVETEFNEVVKEGIAEDSLNVGICTHGGVLINFFNYLYDKKGYKLHRNLTKDNLKVPWNTSVSVIDIDKTTGEGTIQTFGNSKHLGGQYEVKEQLLR